MLASSSNITHMTAAEYRAFINAKSSKPAKHRNQYVYVFADGFVSSDKSCANQHGGIKDTFASVKEYNRWNELRLLERAKKIQKLKKQVPFLISEGFISADGGKHRAAYYVADFTYEEQGREVVEDVKGLDKKTGKYLTTNVFNLKWKLLQAKYPDKTFRLY